MGLPTDYWDKIAKELLANSLLEKLTRDILVQMNRYEPGRWGVWSTKWERWVPETWVSVDPGEEPLRFDSYKAAYMAATGWCIQFGQHYVARRIF